MVEVRVHRYGMDRGAQTLDLSLLGYLQATHYLPEGTIEQDPNSTLVVPKVSVISPFNAQGNDRWVFMEVSGWEPLSAFRGKHKFRVLNRRAISLNSNNSASPTQTSTCT